MPEPGLSDIILYDVDPHSGWASKAVAVGELIKDCGRGKVMYSHVAIFEKPGWQIEAKVPRVCRSRIEERRRPLILPIPGITHDQRLLMIATARAHIGDWYNMLGLLTAGVLGPIHQEVCSQLVDVSTRGAGIVIPRQGLKLLAPNPIADFLGAGDGRPGAGRRR
jgi:hypothetical protein